MTTATALDAYSALDEFLEVIFTDEDLFEVAFASVIGSWDATPPYLAIRCPRVAVAHVGPNRLWEVRPDDREPTGREPRERAWRLRTARSPPPRDAEGHRSSHCGE
jgi:hypothetical protein